MREIASTVYTGFLWGIVLAWAAFLVHGAGIRTLPFVGLPLFAAWALGERRGYASGVQDAMKSKENPS